MGGGKSPDPNVFNKDEVYSFRRITLAPILIIGGFRGRDLCDLPERQAEHPSVTEILYDYHPGHHPVHRGRTDGVSAH
jgi:hypothetical protein